MTVRTPIPPIVRRLDNRESASRQREENSRLRTDVSRLRIEKAQLRDESSLLRKENSQLRTENSRLRDELYFTHEELKEERDISDIKDLELARNNAMYHILQDEHFRLASL
jgi:regulator of replication initiation timing